MLSLLGLSTGTRACERREVVSAVLKLSAQLITHPSLRPALEHAQQQGSRTAANPFRLAVHSAAEMVPFVVLR